MDENEEDYLNPDSIRRELLHLGIGLSEEFFDELDSDSDWSFVIKWHALLESIANEMLLVRINEPEMEPFVSRIEMSNPKTGKMGLMKAFNLISPEDHRFIQILSEMRNHAVHDIRNINFTFSKYLSDDPEGNKLLEQICHPLFVKGGSKKKCVSPEIFEQVKTMPRIGVEYACFLVAHNCIERARLADYQRKLDLVLRRLGELSGPSNPEESPSGEESNPKE